MISDSPTGLCRISGHPAVQMALRNRVFDARWHFPPVMGGRCFRLVQCNIHRAAADAGPGQVDPQQSSPAKDVKPEPRRGT